MIAKAANSKSLNHATSPKIKALGKTATVFKYGGRICFVAGIGMSAVDVYRADNRVRETVRRVGGWTGAVLGGRVGASLGTSGGMAAAVALGQMGPQIATPEELATVPVFGFIGGVGGGEVDSELGIDVPTEIRFMKGTSTLCLMTLEDWSDIGKVEPCSCSYTFSFYSYENGMDKTVNDSIVTQLSQEEELGEIKAIQECASPKWYWPLLDMVRSDKFFIYGGFSVLAMFATVMMITSPSSGHENDSLLPKGCEESKPSMTWLC